MGTRIDIQLAPDGSFGETEMRQWLTAFKEAKWIQQPSVKRPPLQRAMDELAIRCLDDEEDVALGVAIAWLSVIRAMNLHGEVLQFMLELFIHKRCASTEQRCRVCGCTNEDCSGCVERTGRPCYWVELDLCSACMGEAGKGARR